MESATNELMDEFDEMEATDVVTELVDLINLMAAQSGTPTFQELIGRKIQEYAQFTNQLLVADSDEAVKAILEAHPDALLLNDRIQQYIKLANRGIVDINPSEVLKQHVYNQVVQEVSEKASGVMLTNLDQDVDHSDFLQLSDSIISGAAASQVLGGVKFWAMPDVLSVDKYPLVHPLSSTKH